MSAINANDTQIPTSAVTLPPAQPKYVLRGHDAHVHSVQFLRNNSRLLTGDANGWVVLWSLATKRAVAVWRAHDGAILGMKAWDEEKIITHGRDFTIKVWQLRASDESMFSTVLPLEDTVTHRQQPWLLHSLRVNTLNFCSFAMCIEQHTEGSGSDEERQQQDSEETSVLVAVPGTEDKRVDIFQLPSERRIHTVPAVSGTETGMVMALRIFYESVSLTGTELQASNSGNMLLLLSGYESGHTAIHSLTPGLSSNTWTILYLSQPHQQPILSLDYSAPLGRYFTSSADAIIASHPLPSNSYFASPEKPTASVRPSPPLKSINTKHPGQQSLRVRSDSRIFATAGWDARVRIYSVKTSKEVAVLKWHGEGVYGVDFADILPEYGEKNAEPDERAGASEGRVAAKEGEDDQEPEEAGRAARTQSLVRSKGTQLSLQQRREMKAQATHWLAAGSKDGKVSLWDVY